MFSGPTQYLEVYLPSPTTVLFTVTTRRPRHNPAPALSPSTPVSKQHFNYKYTERLKNVYHLLWSTVLRHTIRIMLVFYVLLFNVAKAQQYHHRRGTPTTATGTFLAFLERYSDTALQLSVGGSLVKSIAERTEWWILAPLSLAVVYMCLKRDYVEESLLVLQGLGIQTSTSSRYFFMGPTTTFIPTTQIQDIVIHEAFKGLQVRFYLAVIVEGATEVVVVFPTLLPRRDILEEVWRGTRKCLYTGIR
ncbi:hypothetical protein ABEF93_005204 [Exophiala dermatitidis]